MTWKNVLLMEERVKFVVLAERDQQCFSSLCKDFGISRKTGYKWKRRKREKGLEGLKEMSRRPLNNKRSISETLIKLILSLKKKHPNWGPKKLWILLYRDCGITDRPHINTIANILRRHGLSTRKKRRSKLVRSPPTVHSEAGHPNHIWGVDFKGWFNLGNGERCDPLTVSDLYCRMILCCKAMRNQQWKPVRKAFIQLFRRYGLPDIIHVDNGVPFGSVGAQGLSKLSIWWISLGIDVEYSRPGKPQDNGCHERMHKTLKAESIKPPSPNIRAQQRRFDRWRKEFNEVRPHESLDQRSPSALYHVSSKRYCSSDTKVEYSPLHEKVLVRENGSIQHDKQSYYIGEAFAGVHVGLLKKNKSTTEVYYANIRLGRLIQNKGRKDPFMPPAYLGT